ncbi:MAG: hypothetical protein WBN90_12645 [Gammaproteobacteria bacterium]|jgi:hypothetical protein
MLLDCTLLLLVVLLIISMEAFMAGVLVYPFGFIVLTVFIVARILYLCGRQNQTGSATANTMTGSCHAC